MGATNFSFSKVVSFDEKSVPLAFSWAAILGLEKYKLVDEMFSWSVTLGAENCKLPNVLFSDTLSQPVKKTTESGNKPKNILFTIYMVSLMLMILRYCILD